MCTLVLQLLADNTSAPWGAGRCTFRPAEYDHDLAAAEEKATEGVGNAISWLPECEAELSNVLLETL